MSSFSSSPRLETARVADIPLVPSIVHRAIPPVFVENDELRMPTRQRSSPRSACVPCGSSCVVDPVGGRWNRGGVANGASAQRVQRLAPRDQIVTVLEPMHLMQSSFLH